MATTDPGLAPWDEWQKSNQFGLGCWLVTLGFLSVVGLGAFFLWAYAGHDRIELIEDPVIDETASGACAGMTEAVDALAPVTGQSPDRAAVAIRAQNDAVLEMVATVRDLGDDRLGGDHPSRAWLEDWESLVQARELQADTVESGASVTFEVPQTEDGFPITIRMSEAMTSCRVPESLVASWP